MTAIISAFSNIFADDEWFNKILVGGFYLLCSPLVIGLIMILGFQGELTSSILNRKTGMPMWRNSRAIFGNGVKIFMVASVYAAAIIVSVLALGIPLWSWTMLIVLAASHDLCNPLIVLHFSRTQSIVSALNPIQLIGEVKSLGWKYLIILVVTSIMLLLAVLFGWMFIVVGWPLVIFLMMVVQTASFAS